MRQEQKQNENKKETGTKWGPKRNRNKTETGAKRNQELK